MKLICQRIDADGDGPTIIANGAPDVIAELVVLLRTDAAGYRSHKYTAALARARSPERKPGTCKCAVAGHPWEMLGFLKHGAIAEEDIRWESVKVGPIAVAWEPHADRLFPDYMAGLGHHDFVERMQAGTRNDR